VKSEEIAKEIVLRRQNMKRAEETQNSNRADQSNNKMSIELTGSASKHSTTARKVLEKYGLNPDESDPTDNTIRIPIVIKADANGSLEAVRESLVGISAESKHSLIIDPIEVSIGHVTISDVRLAAESGAAIFCFNLKGAKDKSAMSLAESEGIRICSNNVIYHLLDEAKQVFSTYFPPISTDKIHGTGIVQAVFDVNNKKDAERVAGLKVQDGLLFLEKSNKDCGSLPVQYRVKRGEEMISPTGLKAKSLRKVKEDVKEVRRGEDCGLCLDSFMDLKEGDVIECFSTEIKYIFI
jgi:translation initiation factor IF-2